MKNILILLVCATLLSCCCSKKSVSSNSTNEMKIENGLVNRKWKLVELNGNKIKETNYFIDFFDENRFSSFAGCNTMNGEYELKTNNQIILSKIISTLMACDNMNKEQEFANALISADSYVVNDSNLSLIKSKTIVLARFELMK